MKTSLLLMTAVGGLLAAPATFAAKDSLQIWQEQRFVAQKRAQAAELAKLRACVGAEAAPPGAATTAQR